MSSPGPDPTTAALANSILATGRRNLWRNFGIPLSAPSAGGGPPSTFDINEFPSLSGGGSGLSNSGASGNSSNNFMGSSAPGSNRPNYVGQLFKDSSSNDYSKPAFDMNYNDFPALPGSNPPNRTDGSNPDANHFSSGLGLGGNLSAGLNSHSMMQSSITSSHSPVGHSASALVIGSAGGSAGIIGTSGSSLTAMSNASSSVSKMSTASSNSSCMPMSASSTSSVTGTSNSVSSSSRKPFIQTTKEGRVTNIPMGMVTDQFGMIGLLSFIRVADTEHSLVSLALGTDLTNLKLDLNSSEPLYTKFPGPWSDVTLKPYEVDWPVPAEYLIYNQIKDKLASIREKLCRYEDDTLFFLFYMFPNDVLQMAASTELYHREWRYHKDDKVWITRSSRMQPIEKTSTYERGTYIYFDPITWRRVPKDFYLEYERLETKVQTGGASTTSTTASTNATGHHNYNHHTTPNLSTANWTSS